MSLRFRPEALIVSTKSFAAGTDAVVAAVAGQRIAVYRCILMGVAASTFQFNDSVTGVLSAQYSLAVGGFFILDTPINNDPWWITAAGSALQIIVGGTGPVAADIWYGQGQ